MDGNSEDHMHLDPRIGILNSGVHYAFIDGYDKPEFRGTREQVEQRLGLRPQPQPGGAASRGRTQPAKPRSVYLYSVRVSVDRAMDAWHGTDRSASYTAEVYAANAREAVKKARQERRDEEGRFAAPATFKATRLA
jgi:hypothetical protein